MTQTEARNLKETQQVISPYSQNWDNIISKLPSGERYLYQLFTLIKQGNQTDINQDGKTFHFGEESSEAFYLKIYYPDTYDRALAFGALGFCEAYMDWLAVS